MLPQQETTEIPEASAKLTSQLQFSMPCLSANARENAKTAVLPLQHQSIQKGAKGNSEDKVSRARAQRSHPQFSGSGAHGVLLGLGPPVAVLGVCRQEADTPTDCNDSHLKLL